MFPVRVFVPAVCSGEITDSAGMVLSPNWPEAYDKGQDCIWGIHVEEDKRIMLDIQVYVCRWEVSIQSPGRPPVRPSIHPSIHSCSVTALHSGGARASLSYLWLRALRALKVTTWTSHQFITPQKNNHSPQSFALKLSSFQLA